MIPQFNTAQFIRDHIIQRKESLLAEDLRKFDAELRKELDGKSCLVIGGAGTIGSSYIRALLRFKIRKLVVIDINENELTELVRDIRSNSELLVPDDLKTYPINFGDPVFKKLFFYHGPFDVVANFAAHKHVRSEKDGYSIEAMVDNNVFKAMDLLELLEKRPPAHFFCVSTDKAANPVNLMGASKKLMEDVILSYTDKLPIKTARFANVAFSNGSLPAGFLTRINKRQPLSCPLGIKRYFVSPDESGQICLLASILGKSGDIFFPKLDMENGLVAFSDIATDFLKALGYEADVCVSEEEAKEKAANLTDDSKKYPIFFFDSDTSGEKSFEEFYTSDEELDLTSFPNLGVIKNSQATHDASRLEEILTDLRLLFDKTDAPVEKNEVVQALQSYLPNFQYIEKGKGLDQRM
ncbi:polysaccharide biosynthesis protein [Chitinophaga sp. NPDC101104]|uniref:polysaccharide biosynthesis protein n=1 Tax=Chitinophaga sp. NPDC101104 TaxID=3390561 RepID=UPI003D062C0E